MKAKILIVVPTWHFFDYAAQAVSSAFEKTCELDPHVLVIDDATWPDHLKPTVLLSHLDPHSRAQAESRFSFHKFDRNGGLTRSWNFGLNCATLLAFDYCCVTNSDVIFGLGWDFEIVKALKQYDLVGPVTNTPGTNPAQYVGKYSIVYDKLKPADKIDGVSEELIRVQCGRFKETTLNGFCMVARTTTWWNNAFDDECVFKPHNYFNSKGEPNPTPRMTLNEYELQSRWHAKGLKSVAALGSYVFHYRAVSRGDKHKKGDWARLEEDKNA